MKRFAAIFFCSLVLILGWQNREKITMVNPSSLLANTLPSEQLTVGGSYCDRRDMPTGKIAFLSEIPQQGIIDATGDKPEEVVISDFGKLGYENLKQTRIEVWFANDKNFNEPALIIPYIAGVIIPADLQTTLENYFSNRTSIKKIVIKPAEKGDQNFSENRNWKGKHKYLDLSAK
jgi:hypothetical protein